MQISIIILGIWTQFLSLKLFMHFNKFLIAIYVCKLIFMFCKIHLSVRSLFKQIRIFVYL